MFDLDPKIAADSLDVMTWPLCQVRLMNDRTYPWLILVPQRDGVSEIHQLSVQDQAQLMTEIAEASKFIERMTQADKINVAALGNVVPQLHVHVIARFETDPAWPRPVWGVLPPDPYAADELQEAVSYMRSMMRAPEKA